MLQVEISAKKDFQLALDGLFSPFTGAHISYRDRKAPVTDGSSVEVEEAIGCYCIIQVSSREEAIEWAKQAPMSYDEVIEARQFRGMPAFPEAVVKMAEGFAQQYAAVTLA